MIWEANKRDLSALALNLIKCSIAAVLFLVVGFLASVAGSMVSYLALSFYGGLEREPSELIVAGVMRFWKFFYLSDNLGLASSVFFVTAANLLVHTTQLWTGASYAVNAVCVLLCPMFWLAWFRIILSKQRAHDHDGDGKPVARHIHAAVRALASGKRSVA